MLKFIYRLNLGAKLFTANIYLNKKIRYSKQKKYCFYHRFDKQYRNTYNYKIHNQNE